ncbi:MAG: type IX secretion system sortase PorU [Chlorobi bacterium]|nr:type IX secretion system sortase PorU [Chlorobiota bacterium]
MQPRIVEALQRLVASVIAVSALLPYLMVKAVGAPEEPFYVLSHSARDVVIVFELRDKRLDTIITEERIPTLRLATVTEVLPTCTGCPMVQRMSAMIAVPSERSRWRVEVSGLYQQWFDLPIAPVPLSDSSGVVRYYLDHQVYLRHGFDSIECRYAGIARGIPLARLSIPVADYDPVSRRTRIIERCTVRITFMDAIPGNNTATLDFSTVPIANLDQFRQWNGGTKKAQILRRGQSAGIRSGATAVKISITDEGVYAVTSDDLAKLGIQIPVSLVSTIKLLGYGGRPLPEMPSIGARNEPVEQPIIVETNPDGSLREVIFYAASARGFFFDSTMGRWRRYINPYTTKTSYILTWGGETGQRATPVPAPSQPASIVPQYFIRRLFFEEDRINAYGSPSGLRWFGSPFDATTGITITTPLDGLALNGEYVEYSICVAHKSDVTAIISVGEHGTEVRQLPLTGRMKLYSEYVSLLDTVRVPLSLVASDQRSILRLRYVSSSTLFTGLLDYVEIAYPSLFHASDDQLHVYTEPKDTGIVEFSVSGFSGRPLCFDVTDPVKPKLYSNLSITDRQATIRVVLDSVQQKVQPRQFFFSAARRKPELERVEFGQARDASLAADMIVIAPTALIESAQAYAQYRQRQSGITVAVIPAEHIYAAFASGIPDPTAIRDFISFAYFNWQKRPRYVLLWGDGHYDYRGITTTTPNYIPPFENDNVETQLGRPFDWSYADDSYTTEDYYGCVDGDDFIMDLAVGRLTVTSNEDGIAILEKIMRYENQSARDSWRITTTLVADDGPTSNGRSDGALHVGSAEKLSRKIEALMPAMIQRKVYMPEYPTTFGSGGNRKPSATESMLSIINGQGSLLLQWIGHGNPRVWAHEEIFDRDKTISLMRNQTKCFFLVAATCDFARFDLTDVQSGAEMLVRWQYGGAIGVFSATRVVYTIANEWISLRFYDEFARRSSSGQPRTLGEILYAIKLTEYGSNDRRYFLLGDPALRLHIPALEVQIDSIQHRDARDSTISVCALEHVTVCGSIRDPLTEARADDFNGVAIVSLFDSDVMLRIQDPAELVLGYTTTYQFWKTGGMLHRGAYSVRNGEFCADFTVPKDATLSEQRCRLNVYSFDLQNEVSAWGGTRSIQVNCIETASVDDVDGPVVELYLDSRNFRDGDIVRSSPVLIVDLFDQTGVNSTGIGIGHKIEAWIDDNLDAVDLTEYYEPSLEDSRRGTAKRQLFNLKSGYHTITVRAWDVLNNFTVARIGFIVAHSDSVIESGRVAIYPVPFSERVTIVYNHNQSRPIMATLMITQLDGRIVYTQSAVYADVHSTTFEWDGRQADGTSLPAGIYPVVLTIGNEFGSQAVVRSLLVKIQ